MTKYFKKIIMSKQFNAFKKILKTNATPKRIALGVAIAIFWNFLPVIGFGSVLTFIAAKLFRASEIVAVTFHLGTGLLIPIFYAMNYITGRLILGGRELDFLTPVLAIFTSLGELLSHWFSSSAVQMIVSITYDFLVGSLLNAILAFLIVYIVSRVLISKFHDRKYRKKMT